MALSSFRPLSASSMLARLAIIAALASGCDGTLSSDAQPGPPDSPSTDMISPDRDGGMMLGPDLSHDMDLVDGGKDGAMDPRDQGMVDMGPLTSCLSLERDFIQGVYAGVLQPKCQSCHNSLGIAAPTRFVMTLPEGNSDHLQVNYDMMVELARLKTPDGTNSLLLSKPRNLTPHGGAEVLQPEDEGYRALERFVTLVEQGKELCDEDDRDNVLQHLVPFSDEMLWRRITLDLAGRLPTQQELEALDSGQDTITSLLDALMREDAFLEDFITTGFNDLLLLESSDIHASRLDNTDYPNATWYDDLGLAQDDPVREKYRDDAKNGLKYQGYALIRHIVKNDLPLTQLLTADYTMVNYASAKSYGVEDQVDFGGRQDRDEFQIARLPKPTRMKQATHYPHAGVISSQTFLRHYSTTETNRNRGRARIFYKIFLNTDLLEIAPQGGGDSQAVADVENPVRDAAQCNVCHYIVDPTAGIFQHFDDGGHWHPRSGGWYDDSFAPGFVDEPLPEAQQELALPWLASQVVQDRRFARAMVANLFEMILGRRPLKFPTDPNAEGYLGHIKAYTAQQEWLRQTVDAFIAADYSLKALVKLIVTSPYYTTSHVDLDLDTFDPDQRAQYAGIGLARLLTPEQLRNKLAATFGERWLVDDADVLSPDGEYHLLYGGIDSNSTIERERTMSPLMTSIARIMSGDVACNLAVKDFTIPAFERRLFPLVEPGDVDEPLVRQNIQHLYAHLLGERVSPDSLSVDIMYDLFDAVQTEGSARVAADSKLIETGSHCGGLNDESYTIRAWLAVVSLMLEDWSYLYH